MHLTVNGSPMELPGDSRLPALIEALRLTGRRVAVELNGSIVPRSQYAQTVLAEGDQVEIVQAIGGG